ncbi:cupin domain-containing protein [Hymenobacter terrenus]|uniref:cupin domain-containing protein n=1 Tax=Hymenobacter terrenus TaxID=1629124 RepID=UPI001E48AC6F|nr:cupin domain-containing protein [Hymenobacter terrenus]
MSTIIEAGEGGFVNLGGLGVNWKIDGEHTSGRFAVVHHPIPPRTLAAHLHYHHREDEYSYVLEGTMGALLGEEVVLAEMGSWVFKPRGQWHTFWNAGASPCTVIELISPAGFENYFRELAAAVGDAERRAEINQKYGLEVDVARTPYLCERFQLVHPSYHPPR